MTASEVTTIDPQAFENHRANVRGAYTSTLDTMMNECAAQFALPEQQATILTDAAQFTVFAAVAKIVEARGGTVKHRAVVQKTLTELQHAIAAEVPKMLNHLVDAAREATRD